MPAEGVQSTPHAEILRIEELEKLIRVATLIGVRKIRLTGGEPLVRKGIEDLVKRVAAIPGIDDVSLTTNGLLLSQRAAALKAAGVNRVNISLDTLQVERYREITRGGDLAVALDGIKAALDAGLHPVKINTVVMRGFNEDEIVAIARLTLNRPLHVRFIEVMPIGPQNDWTIGRFIPTEEIMAQITAKLGALQPAKMPSGNGPAKYFKLKNAAGTIGFITSMSDHFCQSCNRLRLTASGALRPCLYDAREVDLKTPLRAGASVKELADLFMDAVALKPDRHHMLEGWHDRHRVMSQIGG